MSYIDFDAAIKSWGMPKVNKAEGGIGSKTQEDKKNSRIYVCFICGRRFKDPGEFLVHINKH